MASEGGDNAFVKWIRLKLDRSSAKQTEDDTKKTLGVIDGGLGKLKAAAIALASALAAAFAIGKIVNFAREAINAARESEKAWSSLRDTVDAAGESFVDLEDDINGAADAFERATIHDDDEFAEGLQRVIAITGDVGASLNNMGLVADVAARFFDGELGPAADLVAKAMNGNTGALGRMGIQAESAQEALDILAERSMGAAAARAETLDGRVRQLGNAWGNFKEDVGFAIIESEGAINTIDALRGAVDVLSGALEENKGEVQDWITRAIRIAIVVLDGMYRGTKAVAEGLAGIATTIVGVVLVPFRHLIGVVGMALRGFQLLAEATGQDGLARRLKAGADAAELLADNLGRVLTTGLELMRQSDRTLMNESSFAIAVQDGTPRQRPKRPGSTTRPQVSKNAEAVVTEVSDVDKALQTFLDTMSQVTVMERLLGPAFDELGAEAAALEAAISALALQGIDETDPVLQTFADRLRVVRAEMKKLEDATKKEEEALQAQAAAAGVLASALGAAMEGGLGPFAKQKAKQNLLEAAEYGLRAIAASLTGFGAAKAGAFLSLAGRHAALAASWGAIGAASGSGSSGAQTSGGGGGSLSPSGARQATTDQGTNRTPPPADVTVVLKGEGFHALNPIVQQVVQGAMQEGGGRQGNVRVRVVRGTG